MMNSTVFSNDLTKAELEEKLAELTKKYCDLVWYARSEPADSQFWDTTPAVIKTGALNSQSKVEENYPDEIDELRSDESNWQHGFNSGCLAAFRFIQTALDTDLHEDEETGELICFGGITQAEEEFPFLDT